MRLGSEKGLSFISVAIASAILLTGIIAVLNGMASNRALTVRFQKKVTADALAAEILEFFAQMNKSQINGYLQKDPVDGITDLAPPRSFCVPINFLDRNATPPIILRPDPIAALGNPFAFGTEAQPNRSFQVQVVDLTTTTVTVVNSVCNTPAPHVFNVLTEAFMITVDVSWMDKTFLERSVLSTVVPL